MATEASVDPDFTIVMRGYERHEVDAYLRDLVAEAARLGERVAQLESELASARSRAESGASPEEGFRQLGEETTRILVAAESAAREMREKAEREADAERAAAERAARERVENASAHADRIVAEAEARQRDVEAEIRRLEDVRATMVDTLRGAITTTERAIAEVPVIGRDGAEPTATEREADSPFQRFADDVEVERAPGDRTPASAREPEPTPEPDPAPEPTPEPEPATEPEPAAAPTPEPEPEPAPVDDGLAAPVDEEAAPDVAATPAVEETPAADPATVAPADPAAVAPAEPATGAEEAHGGADRQALEAALAEADAARGHMPSVEAEAGEPDPGMLRERSLAGVRPGMLRRLRRALQELQNGVLESVRTRDEETGADDLLPTSAESGALAEVARVFLDAGYRSGRADAPVVTGGEALQDPPTDTTHVGDSADALAAELLDELRTTLAPSLRAGVEAGEPDASLSERVGEVFRDLKGPIIETVVDRHLTAAYGRATLDGWGAEGIGEVRWVLGEETRCPEGMCRANEAEGPVELGSDFPSGHAVPLAHEGCTCALRPA